MKELTIEQKAQRYDEALERAIAEYKDEDRHLKATLERIFPQLKKSKDEKIRKELIDLIYKVYANTSYITCVEHEDMLAWLKKQGEPVEINPTEFDIKLQALIGKFETLPKEELASVLSFYLNIVQNNKIK